MTDKVATVYRRAMRFSWGLGLACGLLGVSTPPPAHAKVPILYDMTVTDVTTHSFSVTWYTSEACFPYIRVFNDAAGTVRTSDAIVIPQHTHGRIRPASTGYHVLQVKVDGLESERAYYFQTETTSLSTGDTLVAPSVPLQVWTGYRLFLSSTLDGTPRTVRHAARRDPLAVPGWPHLPRSAPDIASMLAHPLLPPLVVETSATPFTYTYVMFTDSQALVDTPTKLP